MRRRYTIFQVSWSFNDCVLDCQNFFPFIRFWWYQRASGIFCITVLAKLNIFKTLITKHRKFWSQDLRGRHCLADINKGRKVILKFILKKQGIRMWSEFIWLTIWSSGTPQVSQITDKHLLSVPFSITVTYNPVCMQCQTCHAPNNVTNHSSTMTGVLGAFKKLFNCPWLICW